MSRSFHHSEIFTRSRNNIAILALFAITTMSIGCQSVANFKAADLPADLRALAETETNTIDLSQIASRSINENVIYPGDVLEVSINSGIEDSVTPAIPIRVDDGGVINIPLVGDIVVAGLGLTDAERAIHQASVQRDIYKNPHVSVLMRERRTIQVRVLGAVATPGVYRLPAAGCDLLAAIVAAGGLSADAGTIVEVRHPTQNNPASHGVRLATFEQIDGQPTQTVQLDLREASTLPSQQLVVGDGSVVMVMPKKERSVSILGLVRKPGNYDLPTDESLRLLDGLALAGDRTLSVANRVRVIRQKPDEEEPVIIAVNVRQAKKNGKENLLLAPGDTVVVEETPMTFTLSTIQGFLRFGFSSAIPGL